ncbi:MAG: hypothetical protein E7358_06655 [Clostridiales bacterium]|nr:hypothetical protein [Clostridiales bacterium]
MKKIIIKTIAFSLALLLAVTGIIYLCLATLSPSTLSNLYFRIDAKELSLKYSEKAYGKSGKIEDLSLLVERSIVFKDGESVIYYATELINREDYDEYAVSQGSGYNYYIVGSLCSYLYSSGQRAVAIGTAVSHTGDYTKVNPIRVVIELCIGNDDANSLSLIKDSLLRREDKNQFVIKDITIIEDFLKE